jgi:hypothetical protein
MILKLNLDVLCEIFVLFLKKQMLARNFPSSGEFDEVIWYWLVLL